MKDYSFYLFDADGTLIDTTELIYRCFVHTCKKFGDIDISRDAVVSNIGLTLRRQMEVYFGPLTDDQFAVRAAEHMRFQLSIYPEFLRLFPTVLDGLELLRSRGKRCAIVTSRRRETLDLYLRKTGIIEYFEVIVTPENTPKHKPDPEPVLEALRLLSAINKDKAVFVGDSTYDIECGSRAGVDTAFVTWSHTDPAGFLFPPTYCVSDLTQMCP
jgi:phosphoglycolate phosphatase-like HAD superfamily hydrolase